VTQLTQSLIPRQLSQRQMRFQVNWVNAEWDSTSTESMQNDKIFVIVGVFCVDSVVVESHSVLTQLHGVSLCVDSVAWSLSPRWLSWRRVWLRVDSVWGRWINPKQAHISSSGTFKGVVFIKNWWWNVQMGPISTRKCLQFLYSLKQKINSALTESTQSYE
jgi:hypothetical protein